MKLINRSVIVLMIAFAVYLLTITRELVLPFVLALLIFFLFSNLEGRFQTILNKYKEKPILNATLARIAAVLLIMGVIGLLSSVITSNVNDVIREVPHYEVKLNTKIDRINSQLHPSEKIADGIDGNEKVALTTSLKRKLLESMPQFNLGLMSRSLFQTLNMSKLFSGFAGAVTNITKNMGLILLYLIFLLLERKHFRRKINTLRERDNSFNSFYPIFKRINDDLIKYLKIKSIASMATGLGSFIILKIAGVDFASFWALLIFILNFIPTIGSIIAVMFPIMFAFVQFDSAAAIVGLGVALISVQQLIGNFLEPRFLGKTLNLSPLVILISLGVWGQVWGILGMFLSVPLMVAINIILAHFKQTQGVAIMLSANGIIDVEKEAEAL